MINHVWPLLFLSIGLAASERIECSHPPAASNYTDSLYQGIWYEVGKIQTLGGGAFQVGHICTLMDYKPYGEGLGGDIGYYSRKDVPDGNIVNATGFLTPLEVPGHFEQTLTFLGVPGVPVDYNVIWIDEDTAIEYDCSDNSLTVEYCLHFMSRTTEIDETKLQKMIAFTEELGLNPKGLAYKPTEHDDACWSFF